jgi:hypothetical protein
MTPEQLMEIPGVDEKVVDAFWLALNRYYNPNWIPQGWEHMSNEELRERIRELTGEDPQHPGWEHMSNEELREMMKKETGEDPGKVRG